MFEARFQTFEDRPERGSSAAHVAALRAELVTALSAAGLPPRIVNGGGTASLASTVQEAAITEVTVGSGFLCGHVFDGYHELRLRPAGFFALAVTRLPAPGYITCQGGGFVASGTAGKERLPLPVWPEGLHLLPDEGAGEVLTFRRLWRPHASFVRLAAS